MTIFKKNFAIESSSGLKGNKRLLVHLFFNKGDNNIMATKLFNSLKNSFVC